MLTAEEAREIAQDENNIIAEQFRKIELWINESVMCGNYSVTFTEDLHPYVKRFLENMGYRVVLVSAGAPVYMVNWAQEF